MRLCIGVSPIMSRPHSCKSVEPDSDKDDETEVSMPTGNGSTPNILRRKVDPTGMPTIHFCINRSTPASPQAMPSGTINCLISLLFSIPSLKPPTNGTFAFALQKDRLCTKAAATAMALTSGKACSHAGEEDAPRSVREDSVAELTRLRIIYMRQFPLSA